MLVFFLLIFLDSNVMPQIETAVTYGATPWAAVAWSIPQQSQRSLQWYWCQDYVCHTLLYCSTSFYSTFPIFSTLRDTSKSESAFAISREQWPEMAAQCSLIRYFARNKNHGKLKLMWVASKLGCRELVDRHCCMEPYLELQSWVQAKAIRSLCILGDCGPLIALFR